MTSYHSVYFNGMFNKLMYVFFVYVLRCYDRSRINSRNVQCRWLSVWSIYFNFNSLSCQSYFPRGYGGWGVHNMHLWKFRMGGGLFSCSRIGNSGDKGGETYLKFPLRWGHGYSLDIHKQSSHSSSPHDRLIGVN